MKVKSGDIKKNNTIFVIQSKPCSPRALTQNTSGLKTVGYSTSFTPKSYKHLALLIKAQIFECFKEITTVRIHDTTSFSISIIEKQAIKILTQSVLRVLVERRAIIMASEVGVSPNVEKICFEIDDKKLNIHVIRDDYSNAVFTELTIPYSKDVKT